MYVCVYIYIYIYILYISIHIDYRAPLLVREPRGQLSRESKARGFEVRAIRSRGRGLSRPQTCPSKVQSSRVRSSSSGLTTLKPTESCPILGFYPAPQNGSPGKSRAARTRGWGGKFSTAHGALRLHPLSIARLWQIRPQILESLKTGAVSMNHSSCDLKLWYLIWVCISYQMPCVASHGFAPRRIACHRIASHSSHSIAFHSMSSRRSAPPSMSA